MDRAMTALGHRLPVQLTATDQQARSQRRPQVQKVQHPSDESVQLAYLVWLHGPGICSGHAVGRDAVLAITHKKGKDRLRPTSAPMAGRSEAWLGQALSTTGEGLCAANANHDLVTVNPLG